MAFKIRGSGALAALLATGLLVAGCSHKSESTTTGQVIAHIGSDDITLQELQNELRLENVSAEKQKDDNVVRAALTTIAARKYAVQQAIAAKMDRQPTILLDIMRAREQILATAFVQREVGSKMAGVGKAEIDNFIQTHPAQFGNRQEFDIDQISFQASEEVKDIVAATKDYKTLEQVDAKLNELNIKHLRHPGAIDGATLPENVLASLKAYKSDEIFFLRAGEGATFFKVVNVVAKPLGGDQAQAIARRAMQNQTLRSVASDSQKAAVAQAKFEGDYGRIMAASPAPTPSPSAPAASETPK